MNYRIVTDTCCNLSYTLVDELGIELVPMSYSLDDKIFTMSHSAEFLSCNAQELEDSRHEAFKHFYQAMRDGAQASTSMVDRVSLEQVFTKVLSAGEDILYISFSSGLSGSFDNAITVGEELLKQYPERRIEYVDSLNASAGQGLLCYMASKKRNEGLDLDELRSWTESFKHLIASWFTVDNLQYLARGGRLSKSAAAAGSLLNIKPIMYVDKNGKLNLHTKIRSRKRAVISLIRTFKELSIEGIHGNEVFIGHADCEEDAIHLANILKNECYLEGEPRITYIDPVIGAHSGPGTLALFFPARYR